MVLEEERPLVLGFFLQLLLALECVFLKKELKMLNFLVKTYFHHQNLIFLIIIIIVTNQYYWIIHQAKFCLFLQEF